MGRLMEKTQFTVQDYDVFKAAEKDKPPFENPVKNQACAKLMEMEADAKSDLNTKFGGITNLRRVRVLKDKDITDEDPKHLVLEFETKQGVRDLIKKKQDDEFKKRLNRNKTYPIFVHDARAVLCEILRFTVDDCAKQGFPEPLLKGLTTLAEEIEDSTMGSDVTQKARYTIATLMDYAQHKDGETPEEKKAKAVLFHQLDVAQSLLCVSSWFPFDLEQFLAHAGKFKPKTPFNKNRPHQHKKDTKPAQKPQQAPSPKPPPQA